jgi:hypothetical protein
MSDVYKETKIYEEPILKLEISVEDFNRMVDALDMIDDIGHPGVREAFNNFIIMKRLCTFDYA